MTTKLLPQVVVIPMVDAFEISFYTYAEFTPTFDMTLIPEEAEKHVYANLDELKKVYPDAQKDNTVFNDGDEEDLYGLIMHRVAKANRRLKYNGRPLIDFA